MKLVLLFLLTTLSLAATGQPTLFLIGDSTVRNGRGDGAGALWGWGDFLAPHFDTNQLRVVNRALGGRSSRTYFTEGLWEKVRAGLKPGDFVLMQFGHNDGGELFTGTRPRASLKGNGDEIREGTVEQTGKAETVHSYGWYLRRYMADAKAAGAIPIVLSPVPRNVWKGGKVARASNDYGKWAMEAAKSEGAAFIDLNDIIARRYEELGEAKVGAELFTAKDHTHTTRAGAVVNAACVLAGLQGLKGFSVFGVPASAGPPPADRMKGALRSRDGLNFHFTTGFARGGWVPVQPTTTYTAERGYGFDLGSQVTMLKSYEARELGDGPVKLRKSFVTSEAPFFFSVALPAGNYTVTAEFGDPTGASTNTVKAESRRLMLERVVTAAGQFETRTFIVNLRTPDLAGGEQVRLKDREKDYLHWDDKLTLEFNGIHPCLTWLRIKPDDDAITVFLLGDSTVTDQPREPWNSWGQMLPRFFKPGVAVANHAESGESLKSSFSARRCEKVFSTLKAGDYVFAQFGHNDMKDKSPDALASYRAGLERIVAETRQRGATPVLLSSMERKAGVDRDTLEGYPQMVRDVAKEKGVALIGLHAMSKTLYRALGTNIGAAFVDGTHHNNYGSYELAQCVLAGIREHKLALVKYIADDAPPFDPARPDPVEKFVMPPSPQRDATKPDGN